LVSQVQVDAAVPARSRSTRLLIFLFLLSLPFCNPWIRGDGVGYYAFARAPLIEHNLDFARDYQYANDSFRIPRLDDHGQPKNEFRTKTGHLENHFSVGPAILWSPFLLAAHAGVLAARAFGSTIPADGFSAPYRFAMALSTAIYGFLALLLSFRLARQYVPDRWALLSTIAVWGATALPVYMYFNPSWSHAHSAFTVALFLTYWHSTRSHRTLPQWLLLALVSGLMLNVYYANAMLLFVPLIESLSLLISSLKPSSHSASIPSPSLLNSLLQPLLFVFVTLACLFPTFLTRYFVYGSPFESGYIKLRDWSWTSPALLPVLFSSNHGLLLWTPVLLLSIFGLLIFWRRQPRIGGPFFAAFLAFYLLIACYPDWAGISSFGNRFFISLTPLFILGLAVFLNRLSLSFSSQRSALFALSAAVALFILWNAGLIFQWGTHLLPARGPANLREVVYNQFFVVPQKLASDLDRFFFNRKILMQQIEDRDLHPSLSSPQPKN
jgi:hypothetical protein